MLEKHIEKTLWFVALVAERKNGEPLQRVGILAGGSSLATSYSKGGTAAKSSRFEEAVSRLSAKCVFRLFRSGLVEIPNAFAFSPFFLSNYF